MKIFKHGFYTHYLWTDVVIEVTHVDQDNKEMVIIWWVLGFEGNPRMLYAELRSILDFFKRPEEWIFVGFNCPKRYSSQAF